MTEPAKKTTETEPSNSTAATLNDEPVQESPILGQGSDEAETSMKESLPDSEGLEQTGLEKCCEEVDSNTTKSGRSFPALEPCKSVTENETDKAETGNDMAQADTEDESMTPIDTKDDLDCSNIVTNADSNSDNTLGSTSHKNKAHDKSNTGEDKSENLEKADANIMDDSTEIESMAPNDDNGLGYNCHKNSGPDMEETGKDKSEDSEKAEADIENGSAENESMITNETKDDLDCPSIGTNAISNPDDNDLESITHINSATEPMNDINEDSEKPEAVIENDSAENDSMAPNLTKDDHIADNNSGENILASMSHKDSIKAKADTGIDKSGKADTDIENETVENKLDDVDNSNTAINKDSYSDDNGLESNSHKDSATDLEGTKKGHSEDSEKAGADIENNSSEDEPMTPNETEDDLECSSFGTNDDSNSDESALGSMSQKNKATDQAETGRDNIETADATVEKDTAENTSRTPNQTKNNLDCSNIATNDDCNSDDNGLASNSQKNRATEAQSGKEDSEIADSDIENDSTDVSVASNETIDDAENEILSNTPTKIPTTKSTKKVSFNDKIEDKQNGAKAIDIVNKNKTSMVTGSDKLTAQKNEEWSCLTCTLINPSRLRWCSICGGRRPKDLEEMTQLLKTILEPEEDEQSEPTPQVVPIKILSEEETADLMETMLTTRAAVKVKRLSESRIRPYLAKGREVEESDMQNDNDEDVNDSSCSPEKEAPSSKKRAKMGPKSKRVKICSQDGDALKNSDSIIEPKQKEPAALESSQTKDTTAPRRGLQLKRLTAAEMERAMMQSDNSNNEDTNDISCTPEKEAPSPKKRSKPKRVETCSQDEDMQNNSDYIEKEALAKTVEPVSANSQECPDPEQNEQEEPVAPELTYEDESPEKENNENSQAEDDTPLSTESKKKRKFGPKSARRPLNGIKPSQPNLNEEHNSNANPKPSEKDKPTSPRKELAAEESEMQIENDNNEEVNDGSRSPEPEVATSKKVAKLGPKSKRVKNCSQDEDTLKNSDSIEEEAVTKTMESVSTNSQEPEKKRKMGPKSKKSKETEKILSTESSEPLEVASPITVQPNDGDSMDTSASEVVNNEKETENLDSSILAKELEQPSAQQQNKIKAGPLSARRSLGPKSKKLKAATIETAEAKKRPNPMSDKDSPIKKTKTHSARELEETEIYSSVQQESNLEDDSVNAEDSSFQAVKSPITRSEQSESEKSKQAVNNSVTAVEDSVTDGNTSVTSAKDSIIAVAKQAAAAGNGANSAETLNVVRLKVKECLNKFKSGLLQELSNRNL